MTRGLNVVIVGAALLIAGCGNDNAPGAKTGVRAVANPSYEATLAEGIQFADKPGYPKFIDSVSGMSGFEPGHRWTEGPTTTFRFTEDLPRTFTLQLDLAGAFGPNVDKPVKVIIGDWQGQFAVGTSEKSVELRVSTSQPARVVEFAIPQPISPKQLGIGTDARLVGVDFKRLRIAPP